MIVEDEITTRRTGLSDEKKALLEKRLRGTRNSGTQTAIPRRTERNGAPLSFAQQRLWFLEQLKPRSPLYNLPVALRLYGQLDLAALRKALDAVVARHEALRTRFEAEDGTPIQVIAETLPAELAVIDLSRCPEPQRESKLLQTL